MQWAERMLVAIEFDGTHEIFELISWHPTGVVLEDEKGNYLALTTEDFEQRRPFPAGVAVKNWLGRTRWVYGSGTKSASHCIGPPFTTLWLGPPPSSDYSLPGEP